MSDKNRCKWAEAYPNMPAYAAYHDTEWGVPEHDDRKLFEILNLEGAQAGLSWKTVLMKRDGYRQAFDGFNAEKIIHYGEAKRAELLSNPGIIRNKLKVNGVIENAKAYLKIQQEFGTFNAYIWGFTGGKVIVCGDQPATSEISDKMSKDMKKRGMKFVGSTICYAFMQAAGLVNDHSLDCFRRDHV